MAPIPSRLPDQVLSLISSIDRRQAHISQSEIPKLRTCIGPLSLQQTFAEDLREDTVALTRQIESLSMMVDDQQGEKTRSELKAVVDDFQGKLESIKRDTRAALLASKKAIDQRSKSNRDELLAFSSILQEKQTSSEKTTEDALMKANSDVTDALRRTIALMQNELERSVLSTQMLTSSTHTLRSTSTQHDALSSIMSTSKQLVTALEKSDWMDRVLILSGLVFFFLVVLFILKQRIVDRGIRMAFWWTRFIPSFGDDAELLRGAEAGRGVVGDKMSSVVGSLASAVGPAVSTVLASTLGSVSASTTTTATAMVTVTLDPQNFASTSVEDPSTIAVEVGKDEKVVRDRDPDTTPAHDQISPEKAAPLADAPIPVHVEL